MEVINWKENREVGTICFEVRIPKKKTKIVMEFFYVSFSKKILIIGFNIFISEGNKNIYGNNIIPSKRHWNIGILFILNLKKLDRENRSFWHEVFGCLCCCLEMSVRVLFGHTNSILWVWVWELSTVRARNYKDTRNSYIL